MEVAPMIERVPGVVGGRPKIAGTRMPVSQIVVISREGFTPEGIVAEVYPHLTVAQVRAALDYYETHSDEIEREFAEAAKIEAEYLSKTKTPG